MIALRLENVELKIKFDHSDKEGAYLCYELSTSKMDSLKANDKASRLEIDMEDLQNSLKERQETIMFLKSKIATLQ